MKQLILLVILTLSASGAMAYSIQGSSGTQFVLMCNDGTTNTSSMPPNHNTSVEFCEGHGGVAAGYPKQVNHVMKAKPQNLSSGVSRATDYNSSRSNKNSNH
ncbi:MAG: hypothetical protein ACI9Y1_002221 [Lentisphaeria bacterium]|jgi:hypothetical protein